MRGARGLGPLLLAGLLGGCVVGPDYKAPADPAPPRFAEAGPAAAPAPAGDAQVDLAGWWKGFGDPELDRLVAIALAEAPDVKTAVARVDQARAEVRAARSGLFPTVDATGGFNYQKFSQNGGIGSIATLFGGGGGAGGGATGGGIALPGGSIRTFSAGFDAQWELDLFGGVRRQLEGARAREEQAVWNARDAALSLVAEVCDAYLQLRTAQAREAIARAEVARQQRALKILEETASSGLVPQQDFIRQRTDEATALAAIGPIVADGRARAHAIAALVGRPPEAMLDELLVARPQVAPPPPAPPGLPSELLRRRPDVRAAERALAAATADIGVAVADLYPKLSLSAMPQLLSTGLGNLISGNSVQVTAAAQATFPLLDFGRRKAMVASRRAQAEQAYQSYRKTVLGALRDVEDALVRIATEQDRNRALRGGLADALRSAKAVEARYASGLSDYTTVLDARRTVLSDQDQIAQSDGQLRRDRIALYKALGGGWEGAVATAPPTPARS